MRKRFAILFAALMILTPISVIAVPVASAHQCWSWCDVRHFSNGGLITCGAEHDGEIFYGPYGEGYKCEHYFGGGHIHFYFVSGF